MAGPREALKAADAAKPLERHLLFGQLLHHLHHEPLEVVNVGPLYDRRAAYDVAHDGDKLLVGGGAYGLHEHAVIVLGGGEGNTV